MGGPLSGLPGTIVIPTVIQTSADLLNYWNSMTCLYDTEWVPQYGRITLPICMFHVTSFHEVGKTNVSTKRVILYEPEANMTAAEMSKLVRPSVMRTVVDNAVREPKRYNLEIIIPYMPVGMYMSQFVSTIGSVLGSFASMVGADTSILSSALGALAGVGTLANSVVNLLTKLPNTDSVAYLNKNSLDSMWERTHLLAMKLWTGFQYKFVLITDIDISKKPTEDDVFRGTLQVQEMPILSVNRPAAVSQKPLVPSTIARVAALPYINLQNGAGTVSKLSDILIKATGIDSQKWYQGGS